MKEKSYQIVAKKYKKILFSYYNNARIEKSENSEQITINHLLWMLNEIENDNLSSETKSHRWLGFIQGILFLKGMISIQEERDSTRDIFNGE